MDIFELKDILDETGVYEWSEVEDFVSKYFNNVDAQELSPIIDGAAIRFNKDLELEDKDKADYKIKAKQFVKVYGQMASIIPFDVLDWEELFWFLKFLIPKMVVKDPDNEKLDDLLNSVDLSTYGLQRTRLNENIGLDSAASEIDPSNPIPRGAFDDPDKDPLTLIIESFNDKWFKGWDATPAEQRVKFVAMIKRIREHPDFKKNIKNNPDSENKAIAFEKIVTSVMQDIKRQELELYKLYVQDSSFHQSLLNSMSRIVEGEEKKKI